MPVKIKILPENLANKIAAGEVVERPASVVKELVENSLDAGAGRVFVEVRDGGVKLIAVSDDGCGMGKDDALLAFERHGTSKIADEDDLEAITTLGFRGEALPSIASVSRMRLLTSASDGGHGTLVVIEGGRMLVSKDAGAPRGTSVEVRDLFFNTPARLKFLKSRETEFAHIAGALEKVALAHPGVHFRLAHNDRDILDCEPVKRLRDRAAQVYGTDFVKGLIDVGFAKGPYRVVGFVSAPGVSYADKARQETFVNARPVKSPVITHALYDAFQSLLMKDRHPASILFIEMEPSLVDVNVHPAKREVRFADNQELHRIVFEAVTGAFKNTEKDQGDTATGEGVQPWKDRVREAAEGYAGRDFAYGAPRQEVLTLPRGRGTQHVAPETLRGHYQAPLMQVLDSYIVLTTEEGFVVIDQHAAHERVQYEKVKARHGKSGADSQRLLVPERLDLTAREAALMEGIIPELNAIGIEVEPFGGGSFLVRSRPLFMEKVDVRELLTGVLSDLDSSDVSRGAEALREKVFQLIACKSAVKAGQRLHPEAMNRLIEQLFACESPYTCAHGRPTVVKFTLSELEKMFKRK